MTRNIQQFSAKRYMIRASVYRGEQGFLVREIGRGRWGNGCFVTTRAAAERCKAKFMAGEDITLADMVSDENERCDLLDTINDFS